MKSNFKISLLDKIKTPIINKFYDLNRVKGRAKKQDDVWVVHYQNEIIAACRIQNISGVLFLSTLFVIDKMRNKGIARDIIGYVTHFYKNMKKSEIITFAYSYLESFYVSVGFICCDDIPEHLAIMYRNYEKQGRKLTAMRYSYIANV
ncbi:hypothetical protein CJF42_02895 [Pseudoalteromonas sp. NBT06-2]|uniref:GNAT family N-acetyltransferase n=1 Tax=Pseudoalteromonas sp. NBT06-2 TaxID=2025950 RepID=UPI000BA7BC62|nr:GNAT family N-acetyltransferase [Pseudoalteromonas sp. NBT06-2]PAJ75807.1 hypothetical protein CJF42_02895 [Pseudoalteromonas sp. NBT06-2]